MNGYFDSKGRSILLGKKLGSGGEGAVYETPSRGNDIAAKIYHHAVSVEKQEKLLYMANVANESLNKIAAWPLETLHASVNGPICGFLMPKVVGYEPIHHLYSPGHRKQSYPDKDWAFLVNTARNVAAAFAVIHQHNHIISDVNPNLVFVSGNSVVKLIDCDSFQIVDNGKHYLSEVGVPHFTPPELQGHSSFRGIKRTRNHDNFGLALLIFHILLMGRHPFSGVYSGAGDMPLEKSITQFRYAFGRNAANKTTAPPPNSVKPDILPTGIANLFEQAFTDQGVNLNGRPSATEWIAALESLKGQIRSCGYESAHKYYGGLSDCPWCIQEKKHNTLFFIAHTVATGINSFDLANVWSRITAIESPGAAPIISVLGFNLTPRPLPPELKTAKQAQLLKRFTAASIVLGSLIFAPKLFIIVLIFGVLLFFSDENDSSERKIRQDALDSAINQMNLAKKSWDIEASDLKFNKKLKELEQLRGEYENLGNQFTYEKKKLQQNIRNAQLNKFLARFFIENNNITGIGSARKSVLVSFGIETAADIDRNTIMNIEGFGPRLTSELVNWRINLERQFVFDPSKGVDPADIATVNRHFAQKRKQIEGELLAGAEHLNQIRQKIMQSRNRLLPNVQKVAQQLAQAEADLALMG